MYEWVALNTWKALLNHLKSKCQNNNYYYYLLDFKDAVERFCKTRSGSACSAWSSLKSFYGSRRKFPGDDEWWCTCSLISGDLPAAFLDHYGCRSWSRSTMDVGGSFCEASSTGVVALDPWVVPPRLITGPRGRVFPFLLSEQLWKLCRTSRILCSHRSLSG